MLYKSQPPCAQVQQSHVPDTASHLVLHKQCIMAGTTTLPRGTPLHTLHGKLHVCLQVAAAAAQTLTEQIQSAPYMGPLYGLVRILHKYTSTAFSSLPSQRQAYIPDFPRVACALLQSFHHCTTSQPDVSYYTPSRTFVFLLWFVSRAWTALAAKVCHRLRT